MQNVGHMNLVRHFRVPPGPCIKTRLRAQPLIFSLSCKIKLIYTRKVVHWASFWKWGSLKPLVSPWGFLMPLVPRSLLQLSGRASELVTRSKRKSKGWRSGESARLPPMWPGFKSRRRRHMWVEFVVGSLPCSERFFSRYSGFPLSSKTNTFKFQFDLERTDTFTPVHMNS